jgi:hypothetical protein
MYFGRDDKKELISAGAVQMICPTKWKTAERTHFLTVSTKDSKLGARSPVTAFDCLLGIQVNLGGAPSRGETLLATGARSDTTSAHKEASREMATRSCACTR